jgi:DNA polymerase
MSAESRRLAYLEAIGIDLWTPRSVASDPGQSADSGAGTHAVANVTDIADVRRESTAWDKLRRDVAACTRCPLHKGRTQTVFGVGSETAQWMIIGEAPGAEEDRRGEPFVGRAGTLLDEMLRAIGLAREEVFIANVLKCRPPNNRDPLQEEARLCRDHLQGQINLLNPRIVLAVGRIAAQHLLHTDAPLGQLRGKVHSLNDGALPLVVTYHPAYLLRSPSQKRKAWEDLCRAKKLLMDARP